MASPPGEVDACVEAGVVTTSALGTDFVFLDCPGMFVWDLEWSSAAGEADACAGVSAASAEGGAFLLFLGFLVIFVCDLNHYD